MGVLAAAFPFLIKYIPQVLKTVEAIFGGGAGPQKKQVALSTVMGMITGLKDTGKIPEMVSEENISAIIETIVQQLKITGELGGVKPPAVQNPVTVGGGAMSAMLVFQDGKLAGVQPLG